MKNSYYPSVNEFIEKLRSGTLNEAASDQQVQAIRLSEQENAVSPYTGKVYNVKKISEEIDKIKYKIVTQSPLYRPYIYDMSPTIFTWVVPTMATDGVRLFVNPEFAAGLSFLGKIFVLIHEIMHCIMMHDKRGVGKNHDLFNDAADYEINAIIVDTNPEDFSEKFVIDELHGLYDKKYLNVPVEQIYKDLLKNPPKLPPQPSYKWKIDPTQPPTPPGPRGPKPPKGSKAIIDIKPGLKVRIKSTGEVGVISQVNSDGTYEVDIINESLLINRLLNEGYRREEIVPILPKGSDAGGGADGIEIEDEHEIEDGEDSKGGKGGNDGKGGKDSKGGEDGEDGAQVVKVNIQKNLQKRLRDGDGGRCGSIIDKKIGEQIARAEGYDDEEMRAGEDPSGKWRENAREMLKTYKKMKSAGLGGGNYLIDILGKILKPVINWKSLLKSYVGSAVSQEKQWRIGAKKHLYKSGEYLRRGLKDKKDAMKKAFLVVDASGSMFSQMGNKTIFDRVTSEISHIIMSKKIKQVYVIFFDGRVDPNATQIITQTKKIFKPDLSKASLGGGTNFQSPLDYIRKEYKDAVNLVVFLTDGYAAMPQKPKYDGKFIWMVYDNKEFIAPFGKLIKVTMEDV